MWDKFVALSDDNRSVIAKLSPDVDVDKNFDRRGLSDALSLIGASQFFVLEESVEIFINQAKTGNPEAREGTIIAEVRDATLDIELKDHDMLAVITVTGAYKGQPLKGPQIVQALAETKVKRGINKLALKKVLVMSHQLSPGEQFTQAVAKGTDPVQGQDAKFVPLVEDPAKQVLAPKEGQSEGKVDMLDLGETINVSEHQPVMRRMPATRGKPGITVTGQVIHPKPGKDALLKAGKGTEISSKDPNLLIATVSGMPTFKDRSVDVSDALCLPEIGVATGHVKFKGDVIVLGNIESDMIVRAMGNITVGGFVESADVQAQGDIQVAKGIIGHNLSETEPRSCVVKSGGNITAQYAQFSELQAGEDIHLTIHCMNSEVKCGKNLTIADGPEKRGTLSGGHTKVGGKITCVELGVEGDTATYVQAFARFQMYKDRQNKLKEQYNQAQEETMKLVRKELELKKTPKSERAEGQEEALEKEKQQANAHLEKIKLARDSNEHELNKALEENRIEVKSKVFSHVTIQFGEEKVITKRSHGPSIFSFNKFEIKSSSMLDEEAFEEEEL